MKTYKIIFFLLVLTVGLAIQSCKDNILKPVTNNKSADSLTALISAMNSALVSVNAKDKSLNIQYLALSPKLDSLQNIDMSSETGQGIEYTIYIYDGSTTVSGSGSPINGRSISGKNLKVSGVSGATVTVRSNGQTYSTASADGRAIFTGLKVAGLVNVTISASGYTKCSFTTYFNPDNDAVYWTGNEYSASSNIMLFPTTGANMATYTGQLYVNKSTLDDTVGRKYLKGPTSAIDPLFQTFIKASPTSPNYGPYHGPDYTGYGTLYGGQGVGGTQNVQFDNVTSLAGKNFIYGYPGAVSPSYNYENYNYQPGDIISVTYIGLVSFATISATGGYTLSVASYANEPYSVIATISNASINWGTDDGNLIAYQDDFTYFTGSTTAPAVPFTFKTFDNTTYITGTAPTNSVTKNYVFRPFIEDDNGNYQQVNGNDTYTNNDGQADLNAFAGTTVNRNIFFFPWFQTGN